MNIISFDIEEWYIQKIFHGGHSEKYKEYDLFLDVVLDLLDRHGFKATFFCVGGMATDFPEVVKLIEKRGHEIGCHSFAHRWLNKMEPKEALEDTRISVDALEQCIGKKVRSYRAPAFSIGESSKWAFDVLAECGIEIDSSVYPAARDFGGFPNFASKKPCIIEHNGIKIKEFPIPLTRLLGKEMGFTGGGYFRFFPLKYIEKKIKVMEGEQDPNNAMMFYFHISDLLPDTNGMMSRKEYEDYFLEPGPLTARLKRYVKSNLGKKKALSKLKKLIQSHDFVSLQQADEMIDWKNATVVSI